MLKYRINWKLANGETGTNEVTLKAEISEEHYSEIESALEARLDEELRQQISAEEGEIVVHAPWELKITNIILLEEIPA